MQIKLKLWLTICSIQHIIELGEGVNMFEVEFYDTKDDYMRRFGK